MAATGPVIDAKLNINLNKAEAKSDAEELAEAVAQVMRGVFKDLETNLTRGLTKTFAKLFDPSNPRQYAAAVDDVTAATRRQEEATERVRADMKALTDSAQGFRNILTAAGADSKAFAVIENQLARVLKLEQELESQFDRFGKDKKFTARINEEIKQISVVIGKQVSLARGALDSFTTIQRRASVQTTDALNRESVERRQIRQQEHGKAIAATQAAAAKELAEIRGANQQALVSHRATAKIRIELLQFTLRQIQKLERTIGKIFAGTASIVSGGFARLGNSVKRVGQVVRAENNALTQGLQPALLSRERSISRSFHSQETSIRSSVIRQEKLLQSFNARASTGVVGAATGRSAVGGLIGGGIAVGGVFTLITKLKQGFNETVNLNEALNKTTQIFGDATQEILSFADNSVEALFVTKSAALAAAANFGIFGKAAGLAGPELAKFSKDLTLLATDLASFNNTTIEDATTALAAALRGESEPIRKYGVLLNESVLQQRAMAIGVTDVMRKLEPYERVLAANAEIMAQTAVQQGDAARTADDFANSSRRATAASVEFFASIARVAVPLATVITNGLFPAFQNMTKFILNEVSPALQVVRQGAIGAAAGIGALLVAKTAGEALRFLALSLRFVLTPMGLLVAAFAAIGAAINILANRSPELRRIFDDIRESVGERLSQGLELARQLLNRVGNIITETVIPAAIDLAIVVRDRLLQAFRATIEFVRTVVIPAFERFGVFIRDVILPAVADVARNVRDRLAPAFEAVVEFIQPAVDAFRELGGAIADVFTGVGNFSDVLDAIEDFGVKGAVVAGLAGAAIAAAFINPLAGIALAIAGVGVAFGPQLLDIIRPQVERLRNFLTDFFSGDNLERIGFGFLRLVRRIGEIIGGIVTDRRFVTGLAAVVAAIAATAGAAILGFAEGVRANVPELIDLLGDVLKVAFSEAFKFALSNPEVLLGIIAGATFLRHIQRSFSKAGTAAATGFVRSFILGVRNVFTTPAFVSGLFGGLAGLEAQAAKAAQKATDAFKRQAARAKRDLQALGLFDATFVPRDVETGRFAPKETDQQLIDRLKAVETQFGKAGLSGAIFRGQVERSMQSAGVAVGGFRRVLEGDISKGFSQVRTGLSGFASNMTSAFRRLGQDLKANAVALGQSLGNSIALGMGAALSGQALGTATSGGSKALGLAGILSSALIAGAIAPPGLGIAVAGTVAAVGLVTASLTANAEQAKKTEERIRGYADALSEVETTADAFKTAQDIVRTAFEGLSPQAQQFLIDADLSVNKLAGQIARGALDAEDLREELIALGGLDPVDIRGFDGFTGGVEGGAEAVAELTLLFDELELASEESTRRGLFDAGPVVRDAVNVTSRVEALTGSVMDAAAAAKLFKSGFDEAGQALGDSFNEVRIRRTEAASEAVRQIDDAIGELNRRRTDAINTQIDDVAARLQGAQEVAQQARDAITAFFTGGLGGETEALDAAVNNALSLGQALGEAFSKPGQLQESAVNDVFRQFDANIAAIAQAAFEENPALDSAGLLQKLEPFFTGLSEAAGIDGEDLFTEEEVRKFRDRVSEQLSGDQFKAVVDLASSAQLAADDLQTQWNDLNVALQTDVVFNRDQIKIALISAMGLTSAEATNILNAANISNVFQSGFDEAGQPLGASTVDGYVKGIEDNLFKIEAAMQNMASEAELQLADALEIRSPSKIFMALGVEIPAGVAEGILAGSPEALFALRALSATLLQRLDFLPGTIAEAFASVLEEVPGALDAVAASLDPVSESMNRFAESTFDAISNLESLKDADLSKIGVGAPEGANPLSNAGRVATQFANDLSFRLNGAGSHPPGWVQTEDGTWVPPSFFAPAPLPPNPLTTPLGVNMREGDVIAQAAVAAVQAMGQTETVPGVNIEQLNIVEAQGARLTARETVLAMTAASLGA